MKLITARQLKNRMETKKNRPIDINPKDDFKRQHIKGTINIPYSDKDFLKKIERRQKKRNEEIILCGTPEVSDEIDKMGFKLEDAGFSNVLIYTGKPSEWQRVGLKVHEES